ncbi:MAG TPA: hypothetical protein VGC78_12380 [Gaiellaceae bacterium]|jgi:hypothetical protein
MSDLGIVDALARLQLAARRAGFRIAVERAPEQVRELIALAGLEEALGVEPLRQVEQREQRLGVEEERQLDDPAL